MDRTKEGATAVNADWRSWMVVHTWCEGLKKPSGSGFLIPPKYILTALHCVADETRSLSASAGLEVRAVGSIKDGDITWYTARPCWPFPDAKAALDISLLEIIDDRWELPDWVPYVRIDRLVSRSGRRSERDPRFSAVGLPDARRDNARDPPRDTFQATGTIETGGRVMADRLDLRVDGGIGDPDRWGGMSGAAIFVDDAIVGVVIQKDDASNWLVGEKINAMLDDPGFKALRLNLQPRRISGQPVSRKTPNEAESQRFVQCAFLKVREYFEQKLGGVSKYGQVHFHASLVGTTPRENADWCCIWLGRSEHFPMLAKLDRVCFLRNECGVKEPDRANRVGRVWVDCAIVEVDKDLSPVLKLVGPGKQQVLFAPDHGTCDDIAGYFWSLFSGETFTLSD